MKVAITQRVDIIPSINEVRDCLDINWIKFLECLGIIPIIIPNYISNVKKYVDTIGIDGIILTGGNDIGTIIPRDKIEAELLDFSNNKNIPVIGVCRGMQFINNYCGGSVIKIDGHVNKYHKLNGFESNKNEVYRVNSYHNYGIFEHTIGCNLIPLAITNDGNIEAFKHKDKPWLGIMWHPEREVNFNNFDINLFKNHFGV